MDREQAIEKLNDIRCHVKETSTEEQALVMAIDALKAQLSMEDATKDATSDTISKTETAEHLRRVLEATVPNTEYDEGFIDGVEFGISTVSTMPTAQTESAEGEWVRVHPLQNDDSGAYMCSKCKTGMWEIRPSAYHYCPNCGAKMKGVRQK